MKVKLLVRCLQWGEGSEVDVTEPHGAALIAAEQAIAVESAKDSPQQSKAPAADGPPRDKTVKRERTSVKE